MIKMKNISIMIMMIFELFKPEINFYYYKSFEFFSYFLNYLYQ